jgi:hypothetical protein
MMFCHHHDLELPSEEFLEHVLNEHFTRLEQIMTEFKDDQAHLEADVQKLTDVWTTAYANLKNQIAGNPTAPAHTLDFTSLDKLAGIEEAATTVTPSITPSDHPSLAATNAPAPGVIAATQASPFVDPDGDGDPAPETGPDAGDPLPAPADPGQQAGVAAQAPGQTAASVAAPSAEVTPSTENPPTTTA